MTALHFDVGAADGVLDEATSHGIMALQKTYDLPRTGQLDDAVLTKIGESPAPPAPITPGGEANRVEIDLNRQVLYLYEGGALSRILSVSTGNGERFCSEGHCRNAVTPTGAFKVSRENDGGWESGPLGDLYKPQYFNGGIALHGAKSVPAQPASHGCVRVPMNSADWLAGTVTAGTPVYVAG
jgi:lipoprotein-anchoring transpeptidase ErfK/SrfK